MIQKNIYKMKIINNFEEQGYQFYIQIREPKF